MSFKKDRKGPNPILFNAEVSNDRRKFRSPTSDNMDSWKAEKRSRVRRKWSHQKEDTHARNVRNVANRCVFSMIRGSGGSKSRLAKAAGENVRNTACSVCLGHFLQFRCGKNCTPLWREARFQVKMYNKRNSRTTFSSLHVEKLHAAVARRALPSQNVKNLAASGHFLKFRWRIIAGCCGVKHISKSKCKFWSSDFEKWHAAVAPSTFTSQNAQNSFVLKHFWRFRCRKGVRQKR